MKLCTLMILTCMCGLSTAADPPPAGLAASLGSMPIDISSPSAVFGQLRQLMQSGIIQSMVDASLARLNINGVSYTCLNDTEKIISDLVAGENYAIQFIDADGKVPAGILDGNWEWIGDYEQCNAIVAPFNKFTGHRFAGEYRTVHLYRNRRPMIMGFLPLAVGLCLPDTCNRSDVRALAEFAISPLSGFNISVHDVLDDEMPPLGGGPIAAIVVSSVLVLLVVLGTIVDVVYQRTEREDKQLAGADNKAYNLEEVQNGHVKTADIGEIANGVTSDSEKMNYASNDKHDKVPIPLDSMTTKESMSNGGQFEKSNNFNPSKRTPTVIALLKSFSLLTNTTKLLNTSTANGPLACLNGMRVISMWWVIQGHSYSFIMFILDNMRSYRETLLTRFSFQAIANASFSVDSFFFLSGLLVAYLSLREMKKNGGLNWAYYLAHRYWRLTPLYAFVLLLFATLMVYAVTGPYSWVFTRPDGPLFNAIDRCRDYWWTNLLYISNIYPDYGPTTGCMGWAWYLANDMQFYVVFGPILIILLHYSRVVGWVVSSVLILAGIGIRAGLVSYYGLQDGMVTKHKDDPWSHSALYTHPWTRFSVYIVGILTGHILLSTNCKLRMNKHVTLIGWAVAIGTALAVLYGPYEYSGHPDEKMSLVASGFYKALNRTAWSFSLAWLTIACATGYGGWVNSILSWKVWAPLGRLTYAAYLTHPIVIVVFYFNAKAPVHFTDLYMVSTFVAHLVITYAVSYIVSMVAEAPMMQLEKVILKKQK